jgi:hypothetical protein
VSRGLTAKIGDAEVERIRALCPDDLFPAFFEPLQWLTVPRWFCKTAVDKLNAKSAAECAT